MNELFEFKLKELVGLSEELFVICISPEIIVDDISGTKLKGVMKN